MRLIVKQAGQNLSCLFNTKDYFKLLVKKYSQILNSLLNQVVLFQ